MYKWHPNNSDLILIGVIIFLLILIFCRTETFASVKFDVKEYFEITNFKAPTSLTKVESNGRELSTKPEDISDVIKKLKSISHHDRAGFHTEHLEKGEYDHPENHIHLEKGNQLTFPEYFNSWDKWKGCLTSALYQGSCGSCWAFASTTALSARFYIESCGNTGCFEYPQLNQRALDRTLVNIDNVYKFKKYTLSSIVEYLDRNSDGSISKSEWLDSIKFMHKTALTSEKTRHAALQMLVYVLDFQSLGSIQFSIKNPNLETLLDRGRKTFKYWSKNNFINIKEWKNRWFSNPLPLSAEKLISCCYPVCYKSKPEKQKGTTVNNPQCYGGTLVDAWKVLRDTGTTTSMCIGYNLDRWEEGMPTKNCKELLGPNYSYCSGYNIDIESSISGIEELVTELEDSGVEPLTLNKENETETTKTIWTNPQLFRFKAKNAYKVKSSMTGIQREIMERGPVTTGYQIYSDFQYDFANKGMGGQKFSGKDKDIVGNTKNSLIYMHVDDGSAPLSGHAITIVGWGVYKDIPYWICLNSWGTEWGTSGYTKTDVRDGLPHHMNYGGYFWFVRGINNCEFEDNVVAGQPNLGNISYYGIINKYGWGLPYPELDDVELIPELDKDIMIDDDDVKIKTYNAIDGGGTYVFKNPDKTWSLKSMKTSPYTFFWPDERPKYILGHLASNLNKNIDTKELSVTPETISNLKKIQKIVNSPVVIIGNEQLQIISKNLKEGFGLIKTPPTDERSNKIKNPFSSSDRSNKSGNNIFVHRSIDHTSLEFHKKGTPIYIFPFRELNIKDLEFLKK